ncbi:MAG: helix-turn-helix domain-containing protein [Edaphobacter sp.]
MEKSRIPKAIPAKSPPLKPWFYSQEDCAKLLGVSTRQIRYWISSDMLATRRLGSRTLVPVEELKRFASRDQPSLTKSPPLPAPSKVAAKPSSRKRTAKVSG